MMTKPTSEQVTFLAAGSGATQRNVLDKLRDTVSVKDFGAVGDGVADDTAAIQAAMEYTKRPAGSPTIFGPRPLYFPHGIYNISAPIVWDGRVQVFGAGRGYGSLIRATAAMGSMVIAGSANSDTDKTLMSYWGDLTFDANSLANHCISAFTYYTTFERIFAYGSLVSAIRVQFGPTNYFHDCVCLYNFGNGFEVFNEANSNTFMHCVAAENIGAGFNISTSNNVRLIGCLAESNRGTGVLIRATSGVLLDGMYFEANAVNGHNFTTPETFNIKADVVIVEGSSVDNIAGGITTSVRLASVTSSPRATSDCVVFANGAAQLVVDGLQNLQPVTAANAAAVQYYSKVSGGSFSPVYGFPYGLSINGTLGFAKDKVLVLAPRDASTKIQCGQGGYSRPRVFGRTSVTAIETTNSANLLPRGMERWALIGSGSSTSWVRSSQVHDEFPSAPVWELVGSASGSSDVYGLSLTATDYPQLVGKDVQFGCWVKLSVGDGTTGADLIFSGTTTASFQSGTDWRYRSVILTWPSSGSVLCGIRKIGAAETLLVACPVLCEFGADVIALTGECSSRQLANVFYGTAAPSAGTWKRGDIVWNTTPSAGGDPGWVCTTAGAPGTWKAMANLDA